MSDTANPVLNEQARAAMSQILTDLQSMRDFTIEQAPEVIQQMVAYEATMAWAWVVLCSLVVLTIGITCRIGVKAFPCQDDPVFPYFICGVSSIVPFTVSAIVVATNLPIAIKATFFPKWFIVEKLTQLLS